MNEKTCQIYKILTMRNIQQIMVIGDQILEISETDNANVIHLLS